MLSAYADSIYRYRHLLQLDTRLFQFALFHLPHCSSWLTTHNIHRACLTTLSSTPATKNSIWIFTTTCLTCLPQHMPWSTPSAPHMTTWLPSQRCKALKTCNTITMPSHKVSSLTSIRPLPALPTQLHILSTSSLPFFLRLLNPVLQCRLPPWAPHHLFHISMTRGAQWD